MPPKSSKLIPPSSLIVHTDTPKTTGETKSIELGSPITSLNPLQSTFGIPQLQAIYARDLYPIYRQEIPSSNYFFSKKRKVVLKQEMHQRRYHGKEAQSSGRRVELGRRRFLYRGSRLYGSFGHVDGRK
jgi:hypothetical protein